MPPVGYDHRPMVFLDDGMTAVARVGCERSWTIRHERWLICGEDGRLPAYGKFLLPLGVHAGS